MGQAAIIVILIEFIALSVFCYLILNYFKSKYVSLDVTISVFISWVLGIVGILLLPYDISLSMLETVDVSSLRSIEIVWHSVYWVTFFFAWILLPIQLDFHASGEFTIAEKLRDAINKNIFWGCMAMIGGMIYLIYMISISDGSFWRVVDYTMLLSNTYGILMIIVLMGNGLVGLPKRLWEMSNIEAELIRLYLSASSIETFFQEARYDLEDCELEVQKASSIISSLSDVNFRRYINSINDRVSSFTFSNRSTTSNYSQNHNNITPEVRELFKSKNGLVKLHARVIYTQMYAQVCDSRWESLIRQCAKYEVRILIVSIFNLFYYCFLGNFIFF